MFMGFGETTPLKLMCLASEVRKKRLEHDKVIESKDGFKERFDEILETIKSRDSLLEEFDEEIFNALVEGGGNS